MKKMILLLKSRKFKHQQQRCRKLMSSRARMIYLLFQCANVERELAKLQDQMMIMTKIKVWKMNLRKMRRARHIVEEEVEERHTKRRRTQIHKMKVDLEEGNLSNLFRSRKLRNTRYINPNQTMIIKLKTHTKMIHNLSLLANLKIWILIPMKCMTKKLNQTKDMKFI